MSELRARVRRVLAPIAFLAALGLLAQKTCETETAQATVVVAAPAASRVELELLPVDGTERLAFFHGQPLGGEIRWPVQVDAGTYDLVITLHQPDGVRTVRRRLSIADRATMRVTP